MRVFLTSIPQFKQKARLSLAVATTLVTAAAVICAPFFLAQFARASLPWSQLADIGDAYGGASALLSAAALCGIGASLIYQQKQLKQELISNDRQRHHDLIKLALERPEFLQILEPEVAASPDGQLEVYANLWMHYWLAAWELGEVDDDELRTLTSMMFKNAVAREWWHRSGSSWIGTQTRRGRQRFIDLVSQEQLRASHSAPQSIASLKEHPPAGDHLRHVSLLAVGALAAAAVWHWWGRSHVGNA